MIFRKSKNNWVDSFNFHHVRCGSVLCKVSLQFVTILTSVCYIFSNKWYESNCDIMYPLWISSLSSTWSKLSMPLYCIPVTIPPGFDSVTWSIPLSITTCIYPKWKVWSKPELIPSSIVYFWDIVYQLLLEVKCQFIHCLKSVSIYTPFQMTEKCLTLHLNAPSRLLIKEVGWSYRIIIFSYNFGGSGIQIPGLLVIEVLIPYQMIIQPNSLAC